MYNLADIPYTFLNDEQRISTDIVINLLKKDIKNIRKIGILRKKGNLIKAFDDYIENDNEIIYRILHSKITSAIGKLSSTEHILHGEGSEGIDLIDSYAKVQIELFQKLNISQIAKLIQIDANYVLPYLTGSNINSFNDDNEMNSSKSKAYNLFEYLFGKDKLNEYKDSIDIIYKLQEYANNKMRISIRDDFNSNKANQKAKDLFKLQEEIPLQELKILFNSTIISKCNSTLINNYFKARLEGKDATLEFRDIIETAYGKQARELLESRKELNVHSINSLEVFDPRILEMYGEAFVHDCISYNLHNFQEFLEAVKDPEKSDLFYMYYNILKGVFGANVQTMQKAISEFSYYEEFLKNIKDVELDDTQTMNVINVLCSIANYYDINTLEDLNNYEQIANNKMIKELKDKRDIKDVISKSLFGKDLDTSTSYKSIDYDLTLTHLFNLYSFDQENQNEYSSEEIKLMQIIQFIKEETNEEKLIQFALNETNIKGIRNIVALTSLINKIVERQTKDLNDKLLTIEKIQEVCEREKGKEEPLAYYEEIDGVPIYHLNGMPYMFMQHNPGRILSFEEIMTYEGQGGNSAICARLRVNGDFDSYDYIYGALESNEIISFLPTDANTTHTPKSVIASGYVSNINEPEKVHSMLGNEVAFYRRYRDHSKIYNANAGGKVRPLGIASGTKEYMTLINKYKGKGIPIIVIHSKAYEKMKNGEMQKEDGVKTLWKQMNQKI